jgi:hypothetical protein
MMAQSGFCLLHYSMHELEFRKAAGLPERRFLL